MDGTHHALCVDVVKYPHKIQHPDTLMRNEELSGHKSCSRELAAGLKVLFLCCNILRLFSPCALQPTAATAVWFCFHRIFYMVPIRAKETAQQQQQQKQINNI